AKVLFAVVAKSVVDILEPAYRPEIPAVCELSVGLAVVRALNLWKCEPGPGRQRPGRSDRFDRYEPATGRPRLLEHGARQKLSRHVSIAGAARAGRVYQVKTRVGGRLRRPNRSGEPYDDCDRE